VAEAGGVPQHQTVALVRLHEQMFVRRIGNVRGVADLADVTSQQGSRKRGLADVGMRDKAQRNRPVVGGRHGGLGHGGSSSEAGKCDQLVCPCGDTAASAAFKAVSSAGVTAASSTNTGRCSS